MTASNDSQSASPADDFEFAKIHFLAVSVHALHRQTAASLSPVAQALIDTRSRNVKEIEHTLDHLLDCACVPEGLAVFKALCRYYYPINPTATSSYVHAYREMWDTEAPQHGPAHQA
jgi:hypothetical protein